MFSIKRTTIESICRTLSESPLDKHVSVFVTRTDANRQPIEGIAYTAVQADNLTVRTVGLFELHNGQEVLTIISDLTVSQDGAICDVHSRNGLPLGSDSVISAVGALRRGGVEVYPTTAEILARLPV